MTNNTIFTASIFRYAQEIDPTSKEYPIKMQPSKPQTETAFRIRDVRAHTLFCADTLPLTNWDKTEG